LRKELVKRLGEKEINHLHVMFQISDRPTLLRFKMKIRHRRLGVNIESKFRTFCAFVKLGKMSERILPVLPRSIGLNL